jgi:2-octaprenyl-6-methoxyphenol hydroxylase
VIALKRFDVLISGGGMVGLPLGLALAQGGLKTVIADAAPPAKVLDPGFDGRVSALAYASVRMLTALGVWERLAPDAQPIREILVSDGRAGKPASPFSLHFDAQEVGAEALGHIAENRHIRAALYQAVESCPNLEWMAPATVKALTVEGARAVARLDTGEEISATLAIAADGRESMLRSQMGIQIIGWSYPQTGIVTTA